MTSNFSLVFDPSTARIYLRTFRKQKLRAQSRPIHVNFMLNCFLPACCLRNLIQGSNPFYFFFHPYVFLYSGIFMLFSLFTFFTKIDSAAQKTLFYLGGKFARLLGHVRRTCLRHSYTAKCNSPLSAKDRHAIKSEVHNLEILKKNKKRNGQCGECNVIVCSRYRNRNVTTIIVNE